MVTKNFRRFLSCLIFLIAAKAQSANLCQSQRLGLDNVSGTFESPPQGALKGTLAQRKQEVIHEKRDLVYLNQHGIGDDPLNLFKEGLDLENENPLRVSSEEGVLEVYAASFLWTDLETDAGFVSTIEVLEFSSSWQRYLVTVWARNNMSYQVLINVDRQQKKARVCAREATDKKWNWVANYSR